MSDVPELDRLLDEANSVKRNMAWERQDRFFRRTMGCMFLSLLSLPVLFALFGKNGVVISMACVLLSALPVLVLSIYVVLVDCFTDPPPRDATKRYNRR